MGKELAAGYRAHGCCGPGMTWGPGAPNVVFCLLFEACIPGAVCQAKGAELGLSGRPLCLGRCLVHCDA